MAITSSSGRRPWTFYALAAVFTAYVLFLYGPMFCIYLLSFQGAQGALSFPMRGVSLHWFAQLAEQGDTGDLVGAISRSLPLVIASLVAPGYVLGIGIGLMFQLLGWETNWDTSALGAQLSWTLPFGLLIMFAVFGRFSRSYEEAARDLGAGPVATLRLVVVPILLPGIIAVALFGFTLSYDEFARTLQSVGSNNTLPIEIWSMTQNVTSPSIYALGTVTTAVSFVVIGVALGSIALIERRRGGVQS
jgi:putative spermidine/putrescine transport system permease protein